MTTLVPPGWCAAIVSMTQTFGMAHDPRICQSTDVDSPTSQEIYSMVAMALRLHTAEHI